VFHGAAGGRVTDAGGRRSRESRWLQRSDRGQPFALRASAWTTRDPARGRV